MMIKLMHRRCSLLGDWGCGAVQVVGQRLRQLRKRLSTKLGREVTAAEVALALGIGKSTMYMYERGERVPPADNLNALADYYGVSVDYLLGRTSDPTPSRSLTPTERLERLGAMLRSEGATEEDVKTIMELLESRRRLREAVEQTDKQRRDEK